MGNNEGGPAITGQGIEGRGGGIVKTIYEMHRVCVSVYLCMCLCVILISEKINAPVVDMGNCESELYEALS